MDEHALRQAGQELDRWSRTMILTHARPDGDALGAVKAMLSLINSTSRRATAFLFDDPPGRYRFLTSGKDFEKLAMLPSGDLARQFDGILILDTCSWSQLEPAANLLRKTTVPKIVLDHHATRDDLSGTPQGGSSQPADLYLIDPSASSCCLMVFEWSQAMGWSPDAEAAEAIFAGLMTDTGWLRFSNTDGRTLRAAAALVDLGVRPDVLYSRLFASYPAARTRLMAEVLSSLEFHRQNTVASMRLTPDMFQRAGAAPADAEDLVNEPMAAEPVIVSLLFTDLQDGRIRVNFRSKSPEVAGVDVDVAALAASFGGGGHRRAAGATIDGTLEQISEKVLSQAVAAVQQVTGSE